MEFWKLFVVALMPVLKVLLITALGTILAINRFHILGENTRKNLNTLVYFVFDPALVCSSLAETITLRSVVILWFMPVNILLTFVIGSLLGFLLVKLTKKSWKFAYNYSSKHLCKQSGNPFGDVNVCSKNALAYASLSMALGSVYIWSYAYNLVRLYAPKICNEAKIVENSMENSMSITKSDLENPSTCSKGLPVVSVIDDKSQSEDHVKHFEIHRTKCDDGKTEELYMITNLRVLRAQKVEMIMKQLKRLIKKINLKILFTPSTIGAIVGLIIGVVPQFRKLLIGDKAPFHVVEDSIVMVGYACIPSNDFVGWSKSYKSLNGFGKGLPMIVGITVIRCIVLPRIGVGIVKCVVHLGLIHPDPLYEFVLLLRLAVPPASTITQLFGVGEGECSVIMLATYSCAAVSVTLWSTFYMWLVL
ncbi:hypothetical protein ACSQ67_020872 [Phaseolus vulgaris]